MPTGTCQTDTGTPAGTYQTNKGRTPTVIYEWSLSQEARTGGVAGSFGA